MVYKYIINGTPGSHVKYSGFLKHKVWNSSKQEELKSRLSLQNQHDEILGRIIPGPLKLEAKFYFNPRAKHTVDDRHIDAPSIICLLHFLDNVAAGILYDKDCVIESIKIKKAYSKKPRTELKIERKD